MQSNILTRLDRRLSQLEKEAHELRLRLENQTSPPTWAAQIPTPTVSLNGSITGISPVLNNSSTSPPANVNPILSPPAEENQDPVDFKIQVGPTGTLTRSIEGVTVSATVIDELFQG